MNHFNADTRTARREACKQPVMVRVDFYLISGGRLSLSATIKDYSSWGASIEITQPVSAEDLFILTIPEAATDAVQPRALYRVVRCSPIDNQYWNVGAEITELDPSPATVNRYLALGRARRGKAI